MPDSRIVIPEEWKKLEIEHRQGVILVIGAPDTGKSTLAAYLYERVAAADRKAAFLDGDPGQSALGPPTTISLLVNQTGESRFPPMGAVWRKFIGSISPIGHMLPMLVGAGRLVARAKMEGCEAIVYDTCGLVDAVEGGQALKYAIFDLLQPTLVLALQREDELEPFLTGLRRSQRAEVQTLKPCAAVQPRSQERRKAHRIDKFASYFHTAKITRLDWMNLAVFPAPRFSLQRLVALEDEQGFTLGLGIILEILRETRQLRLLSPLADFQNVRSLVLGDVSIDPKTYTDHHLSIY